MPAAVAVPAIGAAASGLFQGAGNIMAANAQKDAAENESNLKYGEQKREFDARQNAYTTAIGTGRTQMDAAGNALNAEASTPNPELATMSADVANRNAAQLQQGAQQMGANLATQGVRGGQATTLLNRGSGQQALEMQQYLDQLKYQDSASKNATLMAYNSAIGQQGQRATNQTL